MIFILVKQESSTDECSEIIIAVETETIYVDDGHGQVLLFDGKIVSYPK